MLANNINVEDLLKIDSCSYLACCSEENIVFVKTNAHVRLFCLIPPRIWVARDQTKPGSFSRETKEPGNEVASYLGDVYKNAHRMFDYLHVGQAAVALAHDGVDHSQGPAPGDILATHGRQSGDQLWSGISDNTTS